MIGKMALQPDLLCSQLRSELSGQLCNPLRRAARVDLPRGPLRGVSSASFRVPARRRPSL